MLYSYCFLDYYAFLKLRQMYKKMQFLFCIGSFQIFSIYFQELQLVKHPWYWNPHIPQANYICKVRLNTYFQKNKGLYKCVFYLAVISQIVFILLTSIFTAITSKYLSSKDVLITKQTRSSIILKLLTRRQQESHM